MYKIAAGLNSCFVCFSNTCAKFISIAKQQSLQRGIGDTLSKYFAKVSSKFRARKIGGWIHIITRPYRPVIICIHPPIPELRNTIQITGQMPSRFYMMPSDVNLNNNISV